jgi:hypothetical protein
MKAFNTDKYYPFAWLDEVVEIVLNPAKTDLSGLQSEQLRLLEEKSIAEVRLIWSALKGQAFSGANAESIKVIVEQYVIAIRSLRQQVMAYLETYPPDTLLRQTAQSILAGLDELYVFIVRRYPAYRLESLADYRQNLPLIAHFKVVFELSTDQLGILIRAAYDIRLIAGDSLRSVFKTLAPYLSTIKKTELSWDSMRSNSGRPERSDKMTVIAALEKVIAKVKEY